MGAVYFYHLTDSPLEVALPRLIERARGAGWRVVVRGPNAEAMDRLDTALWQGPDDGFLAHGRAGGMHDALQPVLLCAGGEPVANDAVCLMAVDGQDVSVSEISGMERICVIFDGHDPQAVDVARAQWRSLTGAKCAAQYWAQEDGKWTKKAESSAA